MVKGDAIKSVAGMNGRAIKDAGLWPAFTRYACQDVEICRAAYLSLRASFPATEFALNDAIIRMVTQPQFCLNETKLHEHLHGVRQAKQNLLERVGLDKSLLMSNDKFAGALQALGVDPPTKVSPTTGRETWAFAKSDAGMLALEEHPNPEVQALHAARVGHKSTLEETRTERFISIARATWDGTQSWMPIPLRFSGAHTHRFSGDWSLNMQNLPSRKSNALREALVAPEGYEIVACDAAQIEARLNAWICGQDDVVEQFRSGQDVYSLFASQVYGIPVTKKEKRERFIGKQCVLGLGFGAGAPKFFEMIRMLSADAGIEIDFPLEESMRVVGIYRQLNHRIVASWRQLNSNLYGLSTGDNAGMMFGPCMFEHQAILLPSGLRIHYHNLAQENGEWWFEQKGKRSRIYGGKLLENIVQALDRVCVMEAALRIRKRAREYRLPLAHQIHDEIIYVPSLDVAHEIYPILMEEMARSPEWGLDLPLAAEVKVGPNYGSLREVHIPST